MDALLKAVQKPHYWREFEPAPILPGDTGAGLIAGNYQKNTTELAHSLGAQAMGGLPEYRKSTWILTWRAKRHCAQGDISRAMAETAAMVKFGRLVSGRGLLVEQLVGIAVQAVGQGELLDILAS